MDESKVDYIRAYFRSQLIKEIQIINWGNSKPNVNNEAKSIYGNRLTTSFIDNKSFILEITDVNYNDTGDYFMKVLLENHKTANNTVTVNIHGMFYCYIFMFFGKSLKASLTDNLSDKTEVSIT